MNRNEVLQSNLKSGSRFVRICGTVIAGIVLACSIGVAKLPAQILAKGAQWQQVSHDAKVWAEGVVAAKNGTIYFSDLTYTMAIKENNPHGTIYRYDPATGVTTKYMEPSGMSNGMTVDKNGDLIICQDADTGGRAVLRRNLTTGKTVMLADSYEGKRFSGPNDVTSDNQGRIYFTDTRYGGDEPMVLPHAFYRIDPDGKLTRLAMDIFRPNGIELSPDNRRLYVMAFNLKGLPVNPNGPAEDKFGLTSGGAVVYDLDKAGNISNGRVFFHCEDGFGIDGTAMDSNGNLYAAQHNGNFQDPKSDIVVISPSGKVLQHIPPPPGALLTTNLAFGRGADSHTLYVTTGGPTPGLFRIQTVVHGYFPK
jgi:gluconolactonase